MVQWEAKGQEVMEVNKMTSWETVDKMVMPNQRVGSNAHAQPMTMITWSCPTTDQDHMVMHGQQSEYSLASNQTVNLL